MSRPFVFTPKEYYHCYSRGTDKRKIFINKKDYERFVALLFVCNNDESIHLSDHTEKSFSEIFGIHRNSQIVSVGAYCLMPNHFHLLLYEKQEGGISLFMQKLATAYTMYFNKRYERTGSLFESRFKAKHLNVDKYLKYVFSYIHLNPTKLLNITSRRTHNPKEHAVSLQNYPWSSYMDYKGVSRSQSIILHNEDFPEYFPTKEDFEDEINDWLNVKVQP